MGQSKKKKNDSEKTELHGLWDSKQVASLLILPKNHLFYKRNLQVSKRPFFFTCKNDYRSHPNESSMALFSTNGQLRKGNLRDCKSQVT